MLYNKKYLLSVVAVLATYMATFGVAISVTERMPEGAYCGNYANGLVVGNVTVKDDAELFDFNMKGLGVELHCKDEKLEYNVKTHHALVVDATNPSDCIGSVLTENNLTLEITYDPVADEVHLDLGFAKITCRKCSAFGSV